MNDETPAPVPTPKNSSFAKRVAVMTLGIVLAYVIVSYGILPMLWERYEDRHPKFDDVPGITETGDKIPGDPLNVALIGSERDLKRAMIAAKWYPADPLTLKSCLEIAEATVLKRPYDEAPVSSLYLYGRKEDLAFEQPVGNDPRQRNHVRFWKTPHLAEDGRAEWIGSATYDKKVGLSDRTGQITHHIGEDIDVERDHLMETLQQAKMLTEQYAVDDFHKKRSGHYGEGDPWKTDGRLFVGVLVVGD
jgi:hypothetical protein